VASYKEGGIEKLVQTNYQGGLPRLDELECEKLGEELGQNIYLTTQSIIEFVIKTFKKTYSQSGMRDLLHRMDYVYKKPKLVPGNPDHESQELFEEQYEAFMREKAEDVDVFFADAVHPEHNAQAAYGWMKRGEVRELKTNSGRQRLNLHGAIHAETHEVILLESETIDSDSTVRLLETLEQKYFLSSEILVILDNAKYHYSKVVQDHTRNIPAYA
jgi:transposase